MASREAISALSAALEVTKNTEGEQYKEDWAKSEWKREDEREMGQHEAMDKELKEKVNKTNKMVLITIGEAKEQENYFPTYSLGWKRS